MKIVPRARNTQLTKFLTSRGKKLKVNVIGAGLAGSEAAWQIAKCGVEVNLYEMRPLKSTPAHKTKNFAELVFFAI